MKSDSLRRHGSIAALALLAVTAGCVGLHGDLCERAAQCGGGGEAEIDACIADLDRREEIASIYGCEDRWDDYLSCLDERGYCDEHGDFTGCDGVEDGYRHCVDTYEHGKAKVASEPGAGSLEPAHEPAIAATNDGAPKPKKAKCSVATPLGSHRASPPWLGWVTAALGLSLLRRRRRSP